MNAQQVREAVNDAEESFQECWRTLTKLRAGDPSDTLVRFQRDLGETLLDLENLYNEIAEERRSLVRRKERLSESWFAERQRYLDRYQHVLRGTIGIGQALGDVFVWFFYQFSPELLSEHLEQPRSKPFPAGDGGAGEVTFATALQTLVEGRLVIHHGITSILRIGDVSLFALDRLEVEALGEVKSKRIDSSRYRAHFTVVGKRDREISLQGVSDVQVADAPQEVDPLPQWVRERLRKQVRSMNDALTSDGTPTIKGDDDFRTGLTGKLTKIARASSMARPAIEKIDDCLVVGVIKLGKHRLYNRLANPLLEQYGLEELPQVVAEICVPNSRHNSLHIGSLLYQDDDSPQFLRGSIPLFWSDMPEDVLRRFYFQKWIPVTVFNPAPILVGLEEDGFRIRQIGSHPFDVIAEREQNGRRCELTGFGYFFRLVMSCLMSSVDVLDLIGRFADLTKTHAESDHRYKFKLDLQLRAGRR